MIVGVPPQRFFRVRVFAWVATLFVAALTGRADEAALRAALERTTGEWTGEVQVKAMDGYVLKTVSAARRAAWEGDTLVVETTLNDGTSDYVVVARQAIQLGRLESSVRRPGQPEDRFIGEVVGPALVWTNAEGNRRDARDQVAERAGSLVLETASVEPIRVFGLSGLVRLEGKFQRPAPAAPVAAAAPEARPAPVADPALVAEVEALRRALEAERAAAADLRASAGEADQRAAAAGRRATEAEARAQTLETAAAEARASSVRLPELETGLATATREREELQARIAALEASAAQVQRDNERILAANERLTAERAALETEARDLRDRLAAATAAADRAATSSTPAPVVAAAGAVAGASESAPSFSAAMREQLVHEVQQMERRVLELESERNTAREQVALTQRQLEETRRLRDDTLLRFQTVVSELNAMREEKDRLARANLSLQAEVRQAQQPARATDAGASPATAGSAPASAAAANAPATTVDGRTADMIIAGLQVIGVTRGDGGEDKAILDGRVYRNGDLVELQLGIIFVGIDGNSLVFQDRRGREYRRRF